MAKGTNQKLKLLHLMKILLEKTDETHSITMPEILSSLEKYDVTAERKSIYDDLEALRVFGIDIIGEQRNKTYYYRVGKRDFELAELKLLVDAVQSSKFITAKKSNELIKKLENLSSKYEASQLQRQVYVAGRIKTMNESIYYNVDKIHAAIGANVKTYNTDGIYGRWKCYVDTHHGGDVGIIAELISRPNAYEKFVFTILRVLPKIITPEETTSIESLYKQKLGTRIFGMNNN
jgi:Fe2+ or Zn2+ uptake regulation protein